MPAPAFLRLLLMLFCAFTLAAAEKGKLSYNRDIRPILAENCLDCHGQDAQARKGGLRLDVREDALKGGKSGDPAIVPGKPSASSLITRVEMHDGDDLMPPPKTGKRLTPEQIATLRQWISSGAEYEGHWAFIAPDRPGVPKIKGNNSKHPIDAFVRARLAKESLQPSPEAAPETLLRRLSLDLTGLPPSPSEVRDFVKAHQSNPKGAYADAVERLLASAQFGEKWARHWLDVARYADSDGYEKDLPRNQWPWRDWVINALNADMPYNQFVIEQVAGDLIPNRTQSQLVATGFLRNGMVNEEGAIINEQFRMEGLFDRMDCLGKAVLGVTLQCAQCHTHKYDPITHEEYFKMFAFLNNDYEATSWIYSDAEAQEIAVIKKGVAEAEAALQKNTPDWQTQLEKWEADMKAQPVVWNNIRPLHPEWIGGLAHPDVLPDDSVLTLGFRPTEGELVLTATNIQTTNLTALRLEALTHGDLPFNGPGRSYKGTFAVSELIIEARSLGTTNAWKALKLTNALADFELPDQPIDPFFKKAADDKRRVGPASYLIDGKDETAWGTDRGPGLRHQDLFWTAEFATNEWPAGPLELRATLKYRHGGSDAHGRHNNFLGRFRIAVSSEPIQAPPLPRAVALALQTEPAKRTPEQKSLIFSHWRTTVPAFSETNEKIVALWKKHPQGESLLTLAQRSPEHQRSTFLMDRGAWDKPKDKVTPGVPAFLHPMPKDAGSDRLAFAKWLVDPKSPTTSRVMVNRVWQAIFGNGLVETPEDFGIRAPLPMHPDLLDWLAVEFMKPTYRVASEKKATPWSTKHLVRLIVHSDTYKQSSRSTPELMEKDPQNKFLARGPRFRAEAEVVRDIALQASGLLNPSVGGKSFYPPVPESMFALNYLKLDWKAADAPERYRRSLYMFRRRSMPDPVMGAFDAPNGDAACVRRVRSNTPLAALTSLNEPVFVEAAQSLAMRVLREGGSTDAERAALAFQLCTARAPKAAEMDEILTLLKSRQVRVAEGWVSAKDLAFADAKKMPELPAGVTPAQAAAWTVVARVLLNLDETVTKN